MKKLALAALLSLAACAAFAQNYNPQTATATFSVTVDDYSSVSTTNFGVIDAAGGSGSSMATATVTVDTNHVSPTSGTNGVTLSVGTITAAKLGGSGAALAAPTVLFSNSATSIAKGTGATTETATLTQTYFITDLEGTYSAGSVVFSIAETA